MRSDVNCNLLGVTLKRRKDWQEVVFRRVLVKIYQEPHGRICIPQLSRFINFVKFCRSSAVRNLSEGASGDMNYQKCTGFPRCIYLFICMIGGLHRTKEYFIYNRPLLTGEDASMSCTWDLNNRTLVGVFWFIAPSWCSSKKIANIFKKLYQARCKSTSTHSLMVWVKLQQLVNINIYQLQLLLKITHTKWHA